MTVLAGFIAQAHGLNFPSAMPAAFTRTHTMTTTRSSTLPSKRSP